MKWAYSIVVAVAMVCFFFDEDEQKKQSPCAAALEFYQNMLFPKDRWIEYKSYIASALHVIGVQTTDMDGEIENYEYGRALAMQQAISQSKDMAECAGGADDE